MAGPRHIGATWRWALLALVALPAMGWPSGVAASVCSREEAHDVRFPERDFFRRGMRAGFRSIPQGFGDWDRIDIRRGLSIGGATTALMLPTRRSRSLDARLQDRIRNARSDRLDRLFPPISTLDMTIALGVYGVGIWSAAGISRHSGLHEYASLATEALGIAQGYHVMLKLLLGREGPYQGEGTGLVHGPTAYHFPGGTPSGHTLTAYALLATGALYTRRVELHILTHAVGLYVGTSLIYNDAHFVSDVLSGAAIGWYVAKWVVDHHSSRSRCEAQNRSNRSVHVLPSVTHRGVGIVLAGDF